jgi:hypothetical protein
MTQEEGADVERARIVAWMRDTLAPQTPGLEQMVRQIALAVERGIHTRSPEDRND